MSSHSNTTNPSSVTEEARKSANLRLLQRTCNTDISDIVLTATHVVLYEYKETAWLKSDVEGSLFLTMSSYSSRYQLIILNRNSANNFVMEVTASMQLQHQEPYLIFRQKNTSPGNNGSSRIRGIWFHNTNERIAIATVLQQTVQKLKEMPPPAPPQPIAPPQPPPSSFMDYPSSSSYPSQHQQQPLRGNSPSADTNLLMSLLQPMSLAAAEASAPRFNNTNHAGAPAGYAQQQQHQNAPTPPPPQSQGPPSQPPGVALDKKSLQLALLSLIQDDRFLELLHSQYLRVVHARAKKTQQQQQQQQLQQQPQSNNNYQQPPQQQQQQHQLPPQNPNYGNW